jgi:hypothetical protein
MPGIAKLMVTNHAKPKENSQSWAVEIYGGSERNQTTDTRIFNLRFRINFAF